MENPKLIPVTVEICFAESYFAFRVRNLKNITFLYIRYTDECYGIRSDIRCAAGDFGQISGRIANSISGVAPKRDIGWPDI